MHNHKGVEIAIASFTSYPKAVEYVVVNHLGLTKEQADGISIFGYFPTHYDSELQENVGKNLHVCRAIVKYKNKRGRLPKTVVLVDDDETNIEKMNSFVESMSGFRENGLSMEDINKIQFKGISTDGDYLRRIQTFIDEK